jgi:glucokinase
VTSTAYAVLDVGGTSIKVGAVSGERVITRPAVDARSAASAAVVLGQLRSAASDALTCATELTGSKPEGLAVAFPGPFDLDDARPLLEAPGKFHAIYGLDLRSELGDVTTIPIGFARDSDAAAVGEAVHGAGRGHRRVLTVAVGTGVGAGLTDNGRPVGEVNGVVIESLFRHTTPHGIVDDVLSAQGLADTLGIDPSQLREVLDAPDSSADLVTGIDVFAHRLGTFLGTLADLGADKIIVAGGVAGSFQLFHDVAALLGAVHLTFPSP